MGALSRIDISLVVIVEISTQSPKRCAHVHTAHFADTIQAVDTVNTVMAAPYVSQENCSLRFPAGTEFSAFHTPWQCLERLPATRRPAELITI